MEQGKKKAEVGRHMPWLTENVFLQTGEQNKDAHGPEDGGVQPDLHLSVESACIGGLKESHWSTTRVNRRQPAQEVSF